MSDSFDVNGGGRDDEQRNEEEKDVGLGKALSCPYIYKRSSPSALPRISSMGSPAEASRSISSLEEEKSDISANQGE